LKAQCCGHFFEELMNATCVVLPGASEHGVYGTVILVQFVTVRVKREKRRKQLIHTCIHTYIHAYILYAYMYAYIYTYIHA
jgi:hypothetical protein